MIGYNGKYCPHCHCKTVTYPDGADICRSSFGSFLRDCRCSDCRSEWSEILGAISFCRLATPDPIKDLIAAAEAAIAFVSDFAGTSAYSDTYDRLKAAIKAVKAS